MMELLVNSNTFPPSASCKLFEESNRSMTNCISNAVSPLKAIYSKAGSLVDSAADEYSKIERDAKMSSPPVGKTMLRPPHNITLAQKLPTVLLLVYSLLK